MNHPRYSIIIPVYNRPAEVEELLESLTHQTFKDFEVIIVEDGSKICCDHITELYSNRLNIQYFFKANTGPGPSRNFGYRQAKGDYLVVFDSDCIIPPHYFESAEQSIEVEHWDAWGGPDKAHENFTTVQRAMGYTMSSILTTGGIRGGKKHVGWFQPRSFNMGISKNVFEKTGGFRFDRYAEDIEFSIRMKKEEFKVGLIPDAYVYHKRRTDFKQFYRQVFNFGKGRVQVGRAHPEAIKITHWFPTLFFLGTVALMFLPLFSLVLFRAGAIFFLFYLLAIFFHSYYVNHDFKVAFLSMPSALLQLFGYGLGFLKEKLSRPE